MSWLEALKAHAASTGKYSVPRKGSPAYEAVRKLMGAAAGEAKAEAAKGEKAEAKAHRAETKALKKVVAAHAAEGAVMAKEAKKVRAPRSRKPTVERAPKKVRAPPAPRKRVMKRGGKTEQATAHSKNPEAVFDSEVNAHLAGSSPAVVADITGKPRKAIARRRTATAPIVNAKNPRDATPFSVSETKMDLGA